MTLRNVVALAQGSSSTNYGLWIRYDSAASALSALANGTGYKLDWWTLSGGGAIPSAGGNYQIQGTAGQPDVGGLSGGGYALDGGYWPGGGVAEHSVYLPMVLR